MRKVDVSEYQVIIEGQALPYNVKESIIEMLFNPERKLSASELIKTNALATKIIDSNGAALLEEAEYDNLLSACNTVRGFSKNDVELVSRILEAQKIEVIEKGE